MGRKSKVTIKDVAAIAGVSRATVSRVLNGTAIVSPDKERAVTEAVERTGFQVSVSAQRLATGRSDSLAVVLTEPIDELLVDPTFATVFQGILEALTPMDMTPMLLLAATDRERHKALRLFQRGGADAVIHLSPYTDDSLLQELARIDMPVVLCGQVDPHEVDSRRRMGLFSAVYSDDVQGARMAGEYLVSRGARKVLGIMGPSDNPATVDRLKGYREAMGEHFSTDVAFGEWTESSGYFHTLRVVRDGLQFDGVVCGNDRIASGVVRALGECGIRVPDQVRVMGFDDHPMAATNVPPLTTVRQPFRQQGALAVRLAEDLIKGLSPRIELLDMEVIPRDTA